jgi:UPF0716 protein FxsA
MKWVFLFLTIPIIEIYLFLKINEFIGVVYTIAAIIATALIGSLLVRKQGNDIFLNLKNNYENPILLVGNRLLIVISGIFLLTPGFITDVIGFLILIPPLRLKFIRYLSQKFNRS